MEKKTEKEVKKTDGYTFMDDVQWPEGDYNYERHSESD